MHRAVILVMAEGPDTAYKRALQTLGLAPAAAPTCLLLLPTVKEHRKSFISEADGYVITLL